jgi:hypothetical protein
VTNRNSDGIPSPNWEQCRANQNSCQTRIHQRLDEIFKTLTKVQATVERIEGERQGEKEALLHAEGAEKDRADLLATAALESVRPDGWWSDTKKQILANVLASLITSALVAFAVLVAIHWGALKGLMP